MKKENENNAYQLEHKADLLKERIYSTLILLAVLVSIDVEHSSPLKSLILVTGSIFSVWAASIVADGMSRRIILKKTAISHEAVGHRLNEHFPILLSLLFPAISFMLSIFGILELSIAVNLAIAYCFITLIIWSVLSARSMGSKGLMIIVVTSIELIIATSVVVMKMAVGH